MEPKKYSLSVWVMACTANHIWLLVDATILQPKGGGHE